MSEVNPRALLLPHLSQYEVDFVIPRIGVDVPLGIDPFLLFKSRDPEYRQLHRQLLDVFNAGIDAVRHGSTAEARRLLDFPEVEAVGLGYATGGRRGSGMGTHLTGLLLGTIQHSESLQERGVHHIEEMQLLSAGIGADRVSDIAANVLKRFLIDYTQRQCEIWQLEMVSGVPVHHIYDCTTAVWEDSYEDLPVSAHDGGPILFVPRRLVRALPWINYDDFVKTEFRAYLDSRRRGADLAKAGRSDKNDGSAATKNRVVGVTRKDISLVERYVKAREQQAANARPTIDYVDEDACHRAQELTARLSSTPTGRESATDYQYLVLEILNYLFNPELIDGKPEVSTWDGTERRDIIFTNDSDETFWDYARSHHDAFLVMFEVKNTASVELAAINQTATYMGDRVGRMAVIVTRNRPSESIQRKIFSVWNDSTPNRKVILALCDDDLRELLEVRCKDGSPTKWLQKHYRAFRTAVQ